MNLRSEKTTDDTNFGRRAWCRRYLCQGLQPDLLLYLKACGFPILDNTGSWVSEKMP